MRVLFTTPPIQKNAVHFGMYAPVGIMLMSAMLKSRGHEVEFIDGIVEDLDGKSFADKAEKLKPDLIGISLNALQVPYGKEYIKEIRAKFKDIPIVVGGPLIAAVPGEALKVFDGLDFAVYGEGEQAILDLVDHIEGKMEIERVRNLAYKKDGAIVFNPKERTLDLSQLPFPDYSIAEKYIPLYAGSFPHIEKPSLHIISSRGCPFQCTFCSSPVTLASKVVFREIPSIIEECELLVNRFGAKEICFADDTLNAKREWFYALCDALKDSGLSGRTYFKGSFRVNRKLVDEEILARAKDANFWSIFYGVESGDQDMLNSMNKNTKLDDIERAFDLTRKSGLKSVAGFLLGCPGETHKTMKRTLSFMKKIRPDFAGMSVLIPFPGTAIYDKVRKLGLADNLDLADFDFSRCNVRTEELTNKDLIRYASIGEKLVMKMAFEQNDEVLNRIYNKMTTRQRLARRIKKITGYPKNKN